MPTSFTRLSRGEFLQVFKRGRRVDGPYFQCIYTTKGAPGEFSVAIVVSKKVAKTAARRNLVRRRVYHALREAAGILKLSEGACILVVRPPALTIAYEALVYECTTQLSRAFGLPHNSR